MRVIETMNRNIFDRPLVQITRHKKLPHIFDVELPRPDFLKEYRSMEFHLVLYPYGREITSDHLSFSPYEEYVTDVSQNQRSSYSPIPHTFSKIFGIIFGLIIAVVFLIFKPDDLFSVESLISIFGAYALGQAIWDDIEVFLINITKKWRVRYMESYYRYRIEKNTTLTNYMDYAKSKRYMKHALRAEMIDFIKHSNSQTVRLYYNLKDLRTLGQNELYLLSIVVDRGILRQFEKEGFLLGVKLSLNKKRLFFCNYSYELFQSSDSGKNGCLDAQQQWREHAIFYRKTLTLGRIKFFIKSGTIDQKDML